MAGELAALTLDLAADLGGLRSDLQGARQATQQAGQQAEQAFGTRAQRGVNRLRTGLISLGAVIGAVTTRFAAAADEANRLVDATDRLSRIARRDLGGDEVRELARAFDDLTLADTADVQRAINSLIRLRAVSDEAIVPIIGLAQNMTTLGGEFQSVERNARQLGLLIQQPADQLDRLIQIARRGTGVFNELSPEIQDTVRSLVAQGRASDAASLVLNTLRQEMAGFAQDEAASMAGASDALSKSWREFRGELGQLFLPGVTATISALAGALAGVNALVGSMASGLESIKETLQDISGINLEGLSDPFRNLIPGAQLRQVAANVRESIAELESAGSESQDALEGLTDIPVELQDALDAVTAEQLIDQLVSLRDSLRESVATFGLGETAVIQYSLAHGDLAQAIAQSGDFASQLSAEVISLTREMERLEAISELEGLRDSLREQAVLFGQSETAALAYAFSHGELARAVEAAGDAGENLKDQIIELSAEFEQFQAIDRATQQLERFAALAAQQRQLSESFLLTDEGAVTEVFDQQLAELERISDEALALTRGREEEQLAIIEQFRAAREDLERAHSAELENITRDRIAELTGIERGFVDDLLSLQEAAAGTQIRTIAQVGQLLTAEAARSNREAFRINQAFAVVEAIINTAQGVTAALKLGPPGVPLAAVIGALGAVQIATILSQAPPRQFGGPVQANRPFLVGEAGPELFVPALNGSIVPNDRLGENGERARVIMNITTPDADSFRASRRQIQREEQAQLGLNRV